MLPELALLFRTECSPAAARALGAIFPSPVGRQVLGSIIQILQLSDPSAVVRRRAPVVYNSNLSFDVAVTSRPVQEAFEVVDSLRTDLDTLPGVAVSSLDFGVVATLLHVRPCLVEVSARLPVPEVPGFPTFGGKASTAPRVPLRAAAHSGSLRVRSLHEHSTRSQRSRKCKSSYCQCLAEVGEGMARSAAKPLRRTPQALLTGSVADTKESGTGSLLPADMSPSPSSPGLGLGVGGDPERRPSGASTRPPPRAR